MHNFNAVGAQELNLHKGALVEVIRKEAGAWWFGRIHRENVTMYDEILYPVMGWFPKDYVRSINNPENDAFFQKHLHDLQNKVDMRWSTVIDKDACLQFVRDANNVTTIVIDSSMTNEITDIHANLNVCNDNENVGHMGQQLLCRNAAYQELLETEENYVNLLSSLCNM